MYKVNINRIVRFAKTIEQESNIVEKNFSAISKAIVFSLDVLFPSKDIWILSLSTSGKSIFLKNKTTRVYMNEYIKLIVWTYLKELDSFFECKDRNDVIFMISKYESVLNKSIQKILENIGDKITASFHTNGEIAITTQLDNKNDLLESCNSLRSYMRISDDISKCIYTTLKDNGTLFSNLLKSELADKNVFIRNGYIDIINSEIHFIYGEDFLNLSHVEIKGMLEKIINMSTSKELVFYAIKANIPLIATYIKNYRNSNFFDVKKENALVQFNGITMENEYVRISNKQLRNYANNNRNELLKGVNFLNMVLSYLESKENVYNNYLICSDFLSEYTYISDILKFIVSLLEKKEFNCSIEVVKNNNRVSVLYKISGIVIYQVNLTSNNDSTIINTKSVKVNIISEIKRILAQKRELEIITSLIENNILAVKNKYSKSVLKSIPAAKLHFLNNSDIACRGDNGEIIFKKSKDLINIIKDDNIYSFEFNDDESVFVIDVSLSKKELEQISRKMIDKSYSFFEKQVSSLKDEYKEKNINFRNTLKYLFPNPNLDIIIEFLYLCNKQDFILTKESIFNILVKNKYNEQCAYSGVLKDLEKTELYDLISKLESIGLISISDFGTVKFNIDTFDYIFKIHSKSLLNIKDVKSNEQLNIREVMKLPTIDLSRYLMHKHNLSSQERILLTTILDNPEEANKIQYELFMNLKGFKEVEKIKQLKLKLAKGDDNKIKYLKNFM